MNPFEFGQLKTIHLNQTDVFVKRYVPADWVSHMLQAFRAKWPRLMPHWMRKRIRLRRIETRVTHRCICPHLPTEETSTHLQWWVSQVEKQDGCNDDVPPVQR